MALRSQMREFALVLTSPSEYFCLYASLSVCLLLFSLCGNLYICLCVYCSLCRSLYNISKYVPSADILKISSAFQLPVTHFFLTSNLTFHTIVFVKCMSPKCFTLG